MADEQLDPAHVGTGFQQMRGERVSQGMRCYWLLERAALTCKLACLVDGIATDGLSGNVARKQPLARVASCQYVRRTSSNRGESITCRSLRFLPVHTDDHALAVYVG